MVTGNVTEAEQRWRAAVEEFRVAATAEWARQVALFAQIFGDNLDMGDEPGPDAMRWQPGEVTEGQR
jgi:hypothetical protein